jgi:hypothetical protein
MSYTKTGSHCVCACDCGEEKEKIGQREEGGRQSDREVADKSQCSLVPRFWVDDCALRMALLIDKRPKLLSSF